MAEPNFAETKRKREEFLLAIFEMSSGTTNPVPTEHICNAVGVDYGTLGSRIGKQLYDSGLVNWSNFNFINLTPEGVKACEDHVEKTYAEEELLVLKVVAERGREIPGEYIPLDQLAKYLPNLSMSLNIYVNELERKGFLDGQINEATKILPRGLEFLQKQSNSSTGITINNNTINAGNFSNNAIGSGNQQSISQPVYPDFDKAIQAIAELIRNSDLAEHDKKDAFNDLETLPRCAANPEQAKRAFPKIEALKLLLSGSSVAIKVAEHLPAIEAFFHQLTK